MIKPAIVAVGYNRPKSMERLLQSVVHADYPFGDITLIVSVDKSDKSDEVISVANGICWNYGNKIIRSFDERQGLRKHILQCGDLSAEYGAVIILEDDLIVSPSFYHYAYQAINAYHGEDRVTGIGLYSHSWNGYANVEFTPSRNQFDVFCGQFSITWGQCWDQYQWNNFKKWYYKHEKLQPNNEHLPIGISKWSSQSWGKYFISYMVEEDKYYVVPYVSMTTNFSEIGQHNSFIDSSHQVSILEGIKKEFSFCSIKEAVTYDVFFERKLVNTIQISGISSDEICFDLNGIKQSTAEYNYVLTGRKMNLALVKSFGLRMRPIEENVLHEVDGSEIFLYRCEKKGTRLPNDKLQMPESRISYEVYGMHWKALIYEGTMRLRESLKRKIAK